MSQLREPHERETPPPAPLWVKIAGAVVVVLLLLIVALHLTGNSPAMHGGQLSPAQHNGQQP